MARYLLDTNIVSFAAKQLYPALLHRLRVTPDRDIAICTITEAEIRFGLALVPEAVKLRRAVEEFLQSIVIEPWDSQCARQYATMGAKQQRLGKPLATADGMIAAHALAYDYTLVTNDKAFRHVTGLQIEDWTKGPQSA